MSVFLLSRAAVSWSAGNNAHTRATMQELYEYQIDALCGQQTVAINKDEEGGSLQWCFSCTLGTLGMTVVEGKKNIRTMRRNHKEGSMNRSRRAISWVWFVKHPVVPLSRSSAVPAPHVLSVGAWHLKANDTLMTFFIKVFSAFVEETQRHTRVCLQPKAASLQRWKWWHSEQTWTQSQGGYANYSTACISKEWNPGSSVE